MSPIELKLILLLAILSRIPGTRSNGLECYACTSKLESLNSTWDCLDDHSPESIDMHKVACLYSDSMCTKYIVNFNGKFWIYKGCAHSDICSDLFYRTRNNGDELISCHTCSNRNVCNGTAITATALPLVLLSMLVFWFNKN